MVAQGQLWKFTDFILSGRKTSKLPWQHLLASSKYFYDLFSGGLYSVNFLTTSVSVVVYVHDYSVKSVGSSLLLHGWFCNAY